MDVWFMILYGFASILALRSLIGLIQHHRIVYQKEIFLKEREEALERSLKMALEQESHEEQAAA